MSEKTLRELRTIWTVATCEILDAHIKSVVASAMAERDPAKPAPDNFADSVNQVPKPEAGDWAMEAFDDANCEDTAEESAKVIRETAERHYGNSVKHYRMLSEQWQLRCSESGRSFAEAITQREALRQERDAALAEVERLRELVGHCYVHSGFIDCGRISMGSDMRELYDRVKSKCVDGKASPATPSPAADVGATGVDWQTPIIDALQAGIDDRDECDDGLVDCQFRRVRPLFDAVRAERDKWREGALAEERLRKDRDIEIKRWQEFTSGDFWAWQGDGNDHLESLTCNVHIMPQELLAIIQRAEAAEAEREQWKATVASYRAIATGWSNRYCGLWDAHRNANDNSEVVTAVRAFLRKAYECEQTGVKAIEKAEAERDIAKSNAAELGNSLLAMTDERDKIAAELREVREAVNDLVARNKRWFVWGNQDSVLPIDAILAAFRAKGKEQVDAK